MIEPDPASITTSPVVAEPMLRVEAFVVPRTPSPARYVASFPLFEEIEATGAFVDEDRLSTANFAEVLAVPPTRRSTVSFIGVIVPSPVLNVQ